MSHTQALSFGGIICAAFFLPATPINAAEVFVTGGFVDFSGVVLSPASGVESYINGQLVCPNSGCSPSDPISGQLDRSFNSFRPSVEFFNKDVFASVDNTHNLVSFAAAGAQEVGSVGSFFRIGTFTFGNGVWSGNADIGFEFVTHSTDSAFDGHVLNALIRMELTPNNPQNTPEENADLFRVIYQGQSYGVAGAYELADSPSGSNIGSVTFIGKIGSLIPVGFADPTGGVYIAAGDVSAVPEPNIALLVAIGLLSGAWLNRRQRRFNRPALVLDGT